MKKLILIKVIILICFKINLAEFSQTQNHTVCMNQAMTSAERLSWVNDHAQQITNELKRIYPSYYIRSWQYISTSDRWCPLIMFEYFTSSSDQGACTALNGRFKIPYYNTTGSITFSYVPTIQIPGCLGYDSNMVIINSVKCYELGAENPLKPKTINSPVENGKWVYLVYNVTKNNHTYDSTTKTVVSGGCSGISVDGKPLDKLNAHDSSSMLDGVNVKFCKYNGAILSGSCEDNGLDTACAGKTPFNYTNNNDSIVNPCKFDDNNIDSIDNNTKRETPPIENNSDSNTTGKEFVEGMNKLSDDIRSEHALDRELQSEQNEESKKHTSLLSSMLGVLISINKNIVDNFKKMFEGGTEADSLSNVGNIIDTAGTGYSLGDTSALMNKLRGKITSDTVDTLINEVDSNTVAQIFDKFKIDFGTGDCDCNNQWFPIETINNHKIYIDICPYNINVVTKWIFKLVVIFILFVFYRDTFFKVLMKSF